MEKNNHSIRSSRLVLWMILLVALVVRVLIFIRFEPWDSTVISRQILIFDQLQYHEIARTLLQTCTFQSEFIPFRTPGYPVYVAFIYGLFGEQPYFVLFSHIGLNLLSIFLMYKIGKELFSGKVGLAAAFLFSLDAHHTMFIYYFLTESIYTTIFLLGLYTYIRGLKTNRLLFFLLTGFVYGLSMLIRPISQYYIYGIFVFTLMWYYKDWKNGIKWAAVVIVAYFITIAPWSYRNYHTFGHYAVSNIKGYNFLFWNASYFEAKRQQKTIEEINASFIDTLKTRGWRPDSNPFEKERIDGELAKEILTANFPDYLKMHLIGTVKIHLSVGTQSLTDVLHIPAKKWTEEEKYTNGVIPLIQKFFATKTIYEILLGSFVAVFLGIVYFFAAIGIWRMIREKQILLMLFLLGSAGYFALASGIISYARYRLPSMPFYILLACFGMAFLWDKYQKKKLSAK